MVQKGMVELNEKRRDELIDIARIVAMTIIVVGHVNIRSPYEHGSPLLSWMSFLGEMGGGVTFFFFFAGYFTKREGSKFPFRRSLQIFISLCIWAIIGYFCFGIIQQLYDTGHVKFVELCTTDILGAIGTIYTVSTPGSCDLWFLKVLLALSMFAPLWQRLSSSRLIVVSCAFLLMDVIQKHLPQHMLEYVPYVLKIWEPLALFCLGMFLRRWVKPSDFCRYVRPVWLWIILLCVIFELSTLYSIPRLRSVAPYFTSLLGIAYILSIAMGIQVILPRFASWLAQYGVGVFFIYVVQEILVIGCRDFFSVWPINKHLYAVIPFIIIALCLLGFRLIVRYLPGWTPYLCLYNIKRSAQS